MKKLIFFLAFLGLIIGFIFGNQFLPAGNEFQPSSSSGINVPELQHVSGKQAIEDPLLLHIPALNIRAVIEKVGKDSSGRMDIPKDWNNSAWYSLGPKPGESGQAVIAAHYDLPGGQPGIFYNLDSVNLGDRLIVNDEAGNKLIFEVYDKAVYDDSRFPVNKVFEQNSDIKGLNLITCDGVFDQNLRNYSQRLVVFSKLLE